MLLLALATLVAAGTLSYLLRLARVLLSTRGQPGHICLFQPMSFFPQLFLSSNNPRIFFNRKGAFMMKADLYKQHNSTAVLVTSLIPPTVTLMAGSGQLIHAINNDRKTFDKPEGLTPPVLRQYGGNLLVSSGDEWRRHRRIAVSSFKEKSTELVWDESNRIVEQWFARMEEEKGGDGKTLVPGVEDVMAVLTLLIIGESAFGISFPFPSSFSQIVPAGSQANFFQLSKAVLRSALPPLPDFVARRLVKNLDQVRGAYEEFEREMRSIVEKRREEMASGEGEERTDILSAFVRANLREEGKNRLSDQELLSNAYITLVAGHETTANSLSALFAMLALYPSHQSPVHDEVKAYLASGRSLSYSEAYKSLPVTHATVNEGLRLVGPVSAVGKQAVLDSWVSARTVPRSGEVSEERKVFVPKGAFVRINVSGAHYDENSWNDPYVFDPSRFLGDYDREAFAAFSSGLRGCVGKHFALAEMVITLALVLLRYRIEVPAHLESEWALRDGETERDRRERVLKGAWPFTMCPSGIDLVFAPITI